MSRIFDKGNWGEEQTCPICKKGGEGEVVLIPIFGTESGNNVEAIQIHLDCLLPTLTYFKEQNLIGGQWN